MISLTTRIDNFHVFGPSSLQLKSREGLSLPRGWPSSAHPLQLRPPTTTSHTLPTVRLHFPMVLEPSHFTPTVPKKLVFDPLVPSPALLMSHLHPTLETRCIFTPSSPIFTIRILFEPYCYACSPQHTRICRRAPHEGTDRSTEGWTTEVSLDCLALVVGSCVIFHTILSLAYSESLTDNVLCASSHLCSFSLSSCAK